MNAAAQSINIKFCTSCTPRYRRPLSKTRRSCPICGAKGRYAFRAATVQEIEAEGERRAQIRAQIESLIQEANNASFYLYEDLRP